MRRGLLILVLLAATSAGAKAPQPEDLLLDVQTLTAPEFAGRASGSAEAARVADLLAGWLAAAGLQPAFDGSWFQDFPLKGEGWTGQSLEGGTGRNVAGLWPGAGDLANEVVVVGAHYDHLGRLEGAPAQESPAADQYYPGANDNASGLAVLFAVIRSVTAGADPAAGGRRGLLFVCFDAEEVGLQGSGYLASHMPVPLEQVHAMLNMDTVGQLTDNRLHVSGVGTAEGLEALAREANPGALDLALAQGGWSGSDHMTFNTREVPVLFLFGGSYLQYNTPDDTWQTLRGEDLARVALYADRLTRLLAVHPDPLTWVMVAQKTLRDGGAPGPQNRDTWLGTLPDFTEEISGYKLAGVFDDSPAAVGGLRKGDVMVRLGGYEVVDLPTFTRALRAFNPGDLVELTVERDGRPLNFTIVLGNRQDRK